MHLNKCKKRNVIQIHILDGCRGKWIHRSVYMNLEDETFAKACIKYIFGENLHSQTSIREVLLVE